MNPRRFINFFRSPTGALTLFLLGLVFVLLMVNSRRPFDSKRQLTAAKNGANAPQLPETVRRNMIPFATPAPQARNRSDAFQTGRNTTATSIA